jgi:hypothetical protein
MNSIQQAQEDMRTAYFNGVPGVICSGSVWLIAGLIAFWVQPITGILTLVIGGMFIFPLSVVLCKMLGCTGKHDKQNPLAPLAIEGTFWMLLSIPIAGGAAFYRLEWFFPAMILVIGGRYLTFATLYGLRVYWVFAAALAASGVMLLVLNAPVFVGGVAGGTVELMFAFIIFLSRKKYRLPTDTLVVSS